MKEGRVPVINSKTEGEFSQEKIETQWRLLTGAIQRSLQTNPNTREILLRYIDVSLSEELPDLALREASKTDTFIAGLYQRYKNASGRYLKLPSVPQESMRVDLSNSTGFEDEQTGQVQYGITFQEKQLIAQRYRYARDIKLLALEAELLTSSVKPTENSEPVITEHGCKIFLKSGDPEITQNLLNPAKWENRKQLKDRVYEINVGGKKFILKERKTPFHLHTRKGGHTDTLSAKDEFDIAQDLNNRGRFAFDRVVINWEKPLGYVEFPDGFQFVVFSHDNLIKESGESTGLGGGIAEDPRILKPLAMEINNRRQEFEDEFNRVATAAETKMIYDKNVVGQDASRKERMLLWGAKKFKKEHKRPVKLTYEDFTRIKAYHLYHKAFDYMRATEEALGYTNTDHDGFAYGFSTQGPFKIHIVGFDLEYMAKRGKELDPNPMKAFSKAALGIIEKGKDPDSFTSHIFYNGQHFNRIQAAAYLALLERDKYFLGKALQ